MGHHYYTVDAQEVSDLVAHKGYILEGIACHVFPPDRSIDVYHAPIYRFYNPASHDLLLTGDVSEVPNPPYQQQSDAAVAYVQYFAQPPGTVPLRRFNSSTQTDHHFYTTNDGEVESLLTMPPPDYWEDEGLAGYVFDVNQATVPEGLVPLYRLFQR